jgi:hypothetical protein
MTKKLKEIIIPKDKAVFWLDKHGRWHNEHGEFQHKKITRFFHSSIKKDENGYYLSQARDDCIEKVYFHYEDTALFAVDIIVTANITLVLNTQKQVKLKPANLFIKDDDLYMQNGQEKIKFAERGLMKISKFLEFEDDHYFITLKNKRIRIDQHT